MPPHGGDRILIHVLDNQSSFHKVTMFLGISQSTIRAAEVAESIVITGSCVPGRDCRCEERRAEAAPRPRTPGAVTRPGWRTATDPGPPSGTRQPPHPAPLDLKTARTCPDTRPTWPRVSEARAPPTISACSLSTISGNNPLLCPAWTRTRTIE